MLELKQLMPDLIKIISIIAVTFVLAKLFRFKRQDYSFANPKRSALLAVVIVAIIVFVINPVVLAFLHQKTVGMGFGLEKTLILFGFEVLEIIPVVIVLWISKESLDSCGASRLNLGSSILVGLISGFVLLVLGAFFSARADSVVSQVFSSRGSWALSYFLIIGFMEEFIYRGYLQTRFIAWVGKWKGIILTSLVFSLAHVPSRMLVSDLNLVNALIVSLVPFMISLPMSYVMIKTENITAPAIVHAFWDFAKSIQ